VREAGVEGRQDTSGLAQLLDGAGDALVEGEDVVAVEHLPVAHVGVAERARGEVVGPSISFSTTDAVSRKRRTASVRASMPRCWSPTCSYSRVRSPTSRWSVKRS
jgi:hypothetical protein